MNRQKPHFCVEKKTYSKKAQSLLTPFYKNESKKFNMLFYIVGMKEEKKMDFAQCIKISSFGLFFFQKPSNFRGLNNNVCINAINQ